MYVWQVAGSYTLSYCMGRVPYLVSGMKIYSSVQEQGDCASMALRRSPVKSAPSPLQQGHTDRQTQVNDTGTHRQTAHAKGPSHYSSIIRQENTHIYMYVFMVECMGMTCTVCTVWQVAGSFALSYCKGRVPYLVSGMKIYSSV